jgi:hypothetical protein
MGLAIKVDAGKHLFLEVGKGERFALDAALAYWLIPHLSLLAVGRLLINRRSIPPRPGETWRNRYWLERCDDLPDDSRVWCARFGGFEAAWAKPRSAAA